MASRIDFVKYRAQSEEAKKRGKILSKKNRAKISRFPEIRKCKKEFTPRQRAQARIQVERERKKNHSNADCISSLTIEIKVMGPSGPLISVETRVW